jgi:hypothetical protein
MEPEQSGFHWQVNIYFQFYILILGSVEVPYGVHLPPLSQIKSFPPVLPILKHILQVPVYI